MMKTSLTGFCVLMASFLAWAGQVSADTLSITARNDKPGPVTAVIELRDSAGVVLLNEVLFWTKDDNTFSVEAVFIPEDTLDEAEDGLLRITFTDDRFVPPFNEDNDRNLFIDNLEIDDDFREGEDFDFTDGTDIDPALRGCGTPVVDGRTVAGCGNNGDFVEYLLDDDDDDDDD